MSSSSTTQFGQNQWLVDEMYQRFKTDPSSVDESWHEFLADYTPEQNGSGDPATDTETTTAAPASAKGAGEKPAAPKADKSAAPTADKSAAPKTEKAAAPKADKPAAAKSDKPAPKAETKPVTTAAPAKSTAAAGPAEKKSAAVPPAPLAPGPPLFPSTRRSSQHARRPGERAGTRVDRVLTPSLLSFLALSP